jgi:hypothetical protein
MAFRCLTGSFHYPAAVQLLDSLSAQLQLKLRDQEEQLICTTSAEHGGGSCGDVAVCSVFNLTAIPSDQSQWIADQQLLVSAAKIVCNSGETTIAKVVVDLEAAAAAAQQQETVEPTGRNFGWTADFFYEKGDISSSSI